VPETFQGIEDAAINQLKEMILSFFLHSTGEILLCTHDDINPETFSLIILATNSPDSLCIFEHGLYCP
jgi:hypothetical protein